MSELREEFEAAYTKEHGQDFDFCGRIEFSRENDGPYHYTTVDTAWRWWKIARAALIVELPDAFKDEPPYACYEGGWNDMRGEAVDALTEAGVTVK